MERAGRRPVLLVRLRRAEPLEVEPPRLPRRGGRAAAAVASLHGREQEELLPLSSVRPRPRRRRSHSRTLGAGELGAPRFEPHVALSLVSWHGGARGAATGLPDQLVGSCQARRPTKSTSRAPHPRAPSCESAVKRQAKAKAGRATKLGPSITPRWLRRAYEPGEAAAVADRSLTGGGSSVLGVGGCRGWWARILPVHSSTGGGGGYDLRGLGSRSCVRARGHETAAYVFFRKWSVV
jgi:hypothetical protein